MKIEITLTYEQRIRILDAFNYANFSGTRTLFKAMECQRELELTEEEKELIGYRLEPGTAFYNAKASEESRVIISDETASILVGVLELNTRLTIHDTWAIALIEKLKAPQSA